MSRPPAPAGRKFLTRIEATYSLGLMDAAQPTIQPEALVVHACIAIRTAGVVYEGEPNERLHANLIVALFADGIAVDADFEAGWTVDDPPDEPRPPCGHSACRQHWIDTGRGDCIA